MWGLPEDGGQKSSSEVSKSGVLVLDGSTAEGSYRTKRKGAPSRSSSFRSRCWCSSAVLAALMVVVRGCLVFQDGFVRFCELRAEFLILSVFANCERFVRFCECGIAIFFCNSLFSPGLSSHHLALGV